MAEAKFNAEAAAERFNGLLRGELSAIETYDQALKKVSHSAEEPRSGAFGTITSRRKTRSSITSIILGANQQKVPEPGVRLRLLLRARPRYSATRPRLTS